MRVLSSLADSRIGGPQVRSLTVAESLRDHGVETEFLLPNGTDQFQNRAQDNGFTVHRPYMPRVKPPSNITGNAAVIGTSPYVIHQIRQIIKRRSYDVVHVNMSVNMRTAIASQGTDSSVVWHFNDTILPPPFKNFAALLATTLADQIVVSCEGVTEYYFSRYDVSPITINPPVDVDKFNPSNHTPADDLVEDESVPIVGAVGNVSPIKGYEYLLPAIRSVIDEFGEVKLVIVGKRMKSQPTYLKKLDDLVDDLQITENVEYLGYRDDICSVLSALDLFVMPSISETGPMSLMEAMAMEVPAVTTAVGVVPEHLTTQHAWIVPTADPTALAESMTEALSSPELAQQRAKNAAKKTKELFSVEATVERHLNAYQAALQ